MESPGSPLRFFHLLSLTFSRMYEDPSFQFKSLGWGELKGHRCLKVQFQQGEDPAVAIVERFWIDMERRGNPLQYEIRFGPNLGMRTVDVELRQFSSPDGATHWLPVAGKRQTFGTRQGYSRSPIFEETYEVMSSSVMVNQGLQDRRFSIDWSTKPTTEGLKRVRINSITHLRPGSDPAGVTQHLDKLLANADLQAKELEASAPSRESWIGTHAYSLIFILASCALLATSAYWKRRG